jgi:hypothetical protein
MFNYRSEYSIYEAYVSRIMFEVVCVLKTIDGKLPAYHVSGVVLPRHLKLPFSVLLEHYLPSTLSQSMIDVFLHIVHLLSDDPDSNLNEVITSAWLYFHCCFQTSMNVSCGTATVLKPASILRAATTVLVEMVTP